MAHHVPVTVDDSHDPLNRMRAHQIAETLSSSMHLAKFARA